MKRDQWLMTATQKNGATPWLMCLVGALGVAIALFFVDIVLILFTGSAKPDPLTGQIYSVSLGKSGGSVHYVELWLYVFDSFVMTALSSVILALIVRRMIIGWDQKGPPDEPKRDQ